MRSARMPDPLPPGLPAPEDDGAARHLVGRTLPSLTLAATDGSPVRLDAIDGRWLLFVYPSTGRPGMPVPQGWDAIPGARGCSHEACGFRDRLPALRALGIERIFALSADPVESQRALVARFDLPYLLLSDPQLTVGDQLGLPAFEAFGRRLYKRLTMALRGPLIEHVFYPVFPPDKHAAEVATWLGENRR